MPGQRNPWDIPEWHAIGRETALVRHLIGSGVTALGRANYADKKGEYYTAFFGLSVGLERLAKLILVADYVISNSGQMPEERVVRRFGHKLVELMQAANGVVEKYNLNLGYKRPTTAISQQIVECLDAFADASALTQSDATGSRLSLARMSSAGLVQTNGLGLRLCSRM